MSLDAELLRAVVRAVLGGDDGLDAALAHLDVVTSHDHPQWRERLGSLSGRLEASTGGFVAASSATQFAAVAAHDDDPDLRWLSQQVAIARYGSAAGQQAVGWRAAPVPLTPVTGLAPELLECIVEREAVAATYDAIVIGSGPGGGVAAAELTRAGRSVLVIERGEAPVGEVLGRDHGRNPRVDLGLEVLTGPPLAGNPRVVVTGDGQALELDASDFRWGNNAMLLGGGSRVFGAQAWRFSPEDFAMASTYGVPPGSALADWPFGYDEIESFYMRAEVEWGVAGAPGPADTEGWRSEPFPMPPLPEPGPVAVLRAGAEALGIRTLPVPFLVNTHSYNGRPGCARCAMCVGFACPVDAKNGAQNTVLVTAARTGRLTVVLGAQVTSITTDDAGRVTGVEMRAAGGDGVWSRTVRAAEVVVSAGAVESARLLLASRSVREPYGLGNGNDQVGRYLQAHLYSGAVGVFPEDIYDGLGPGPAIATLDYRHHNDGFVGGGMLANEFVMLPVSALAALRVAGRVPWSGPDVESELARLLPRVQRIVGPIQEMSMADSRVTLDPVVTDAVGMPVARLSGDLHPEDRRIERFLADRALEWMTAAGAETVARAGLRPPGSGPSAGQHQAGSLRMGDDPRTSATDRWGRVWGHDNLRVCDGSLHVTNGGVNPVLTIIANAYRVMSHLD